MVVATHNATPRPNFLIDVARPPGDGDGGGTYATGTVTRKAVLEVKTVLIPLKNYGLVGNLTDNTLTKSLASDAGLSVGNYTVENYADTASMGISIDGVVIYPAINNTLLYATAAAEITSSGAHVGRGGGPSTTMRMGTGLTGTALISTICVITQIATTVRVAHIPRL
jgi:hypothetical protein